MAQELVDELQPMTDSAVLRPLLAETAELLELSQSGHATPSLEFQDIRKVIRLLVVENSVLREEQFMDILQVCKTAESVLRFLTRHSEQLPAVRMRYAMVYLEKELPEAIEAIFDSKGIVKNNASPELAAIRSRLSSKRREANNKFNALLQEYRASGWLRDYSEGYQDGRRVMAVVAEYKRKIKGVVHGASSSGSTTFIEPMNTVLINNEVVLLEEEEKKEVYRILKTLTQEIRPYEENLLDYLQVLSTLDFTRAKTMLAEEMHAILPGITAKPSLLLKQAYHPLLRLQNDRKGQQTMPMNLELNKKHRILVISGPNAGGKSVALKTAGLLQLMLQSGMLVPVHPDSEMCLFKKLLADIGDSQSIEFEVSTYSAKLEKMKRFLELADDETLFLIDEFGSGSDPELGGSLAEVVLADLNRSKGFGILTTHYAVVKVMAEREEGMLNGSMLFDSSRMQPLYRLTIGRPGSSYTFEVAQNVGLPSYLIKKARKLSDSAKVRFDDLLNRLQSEKDKLANTRKKLQGQEEKLQSSLTEQEAINEELEDLLDKSKSDEAEVRRLAEMGRQYQKLLDEWMLNNSKKQILARIIKKAEQQKEQAAAAEKREQQLENKRKRKDRAKRKPKPAAPPPKPIAIGATVRITGSTETGVVEDIKKNKVHVTFGAFRSIVDSNRLEVV